METPYSCLGIIALLLAAREGASGHAFDSCERLFIVNVKVSAVETQSKEDLTNSKRKTNNVKTQYNQAHKHGVLQRSSIFILRIHVRRMGNGLSSIVRIAKKRRVAVGKSYPLKHETRTIASHG